MKELGLGGLGIIENEWEGADLERRAVGREVGDIHKGGEKEYSRNVESLEDEIFPSSIF